MQEQLQFDDEHKPKFKCYLELFIEHLTGKTKEIEAVDRANKAFWRPLTCHTKTV